MTPAPPSFVLARIEALSISAVLFALYEFECSSSGKGWVEWKHPDDPQRPLPSTEEVFPLLTRWRRDAKLDAIKITDGGPRSIRFRPGDAESLLTELRTLALFLVFEARWMQSRGFEPGRSHETASGEIQKAAIRVGRAVIEGLK